MAMKCANCGKGVMYGHNVSHSKRRTPRVFKPNLQSKRINLGNGFVRVKLCTKCSRLLKGVTASSATPVKQEVSSEVIATT